MKNPEAESRAPANNPIERSKFVAFHVTLCHILLLGVQTVVAQQQNPTDSIGSVLPPIPPNPLKFDPGFSASMAIMMVVLIGAFVLLGVCSIYVRKCAERPPGGEAGGSQPIERVARRSWAARGMGLDRAVVESFPTFAYADVKRLRIGKSLLECAVCLSEFEDDETLRLVPKCNHVFHPECIDAWWSGHTTCPVCRANLAPKLTEIGSGSVHVVGLDLEMERSNRGNRPDNEPNEVSISVVNEESTPARASPVGLISGNVDWLPNGFRFLQRFSRSHTTGHSVYQLDSNFERFTLILSEEERTQLVNSSLNRSKSCGPYPQAWSAKIGYQTRRFIETDHKLLNQPSDRQIQSNSSIAQMTNSVQSIESESKSDRSTEAIVAIDESNNGEKSFVRLLKSVSSDRR